MPWTIAGQIGPESRPGVDADGWLWEILQGDDARRVLVEISGTARAIDPDHLLAEDTREAIRTEGESQIVKVLNLDDPPRMIRCGTMGCQAVEPDGAGS